MATDDFEVQLSLNSARQAAAMTRASDVNIRIPWYLAVLREQGSYALSCKLCCVFEMRSE